MVVVAELIWQILEIYKWVLIVWAIMSWLVTFDVINRRNQIVYTILTLMDRLTRPALRPIQRVVPTLGGVDVSPVILLLAIWFVQRLIERYVLLPAYIQGM